jgi:hypothetical protein
MDSSNNNDDIQYTFEVAGQDNVVLNRAQLIGSTKVAPKNRFRTRIQGFVIQDTINNPLFPIPIPILDKGKGYLSKIFKQYVAKYQKQYATNTLPWHFVVEFNKDHGFYVVHNTRPINLKFPFTSKEISEFIELNEVEINDKTKELLERDNIELQEMIHVCIVGDTGLDVYTRDLYKKIGEYIIGPFSKIHKISPLLDEGTFFLNVGKKFKPNVLKTSIKKL